MIRRYLDFELHVTSDNQELVIDINGRPYAINLPHPITVRLESHLPNWKKPGLDAPGMAQLGHSLYGTVFVKEVESRFQAYVNRREQEEGVRICIHAHSSVLSSAIWEALCNQLTPVVNFLALDPKTPVVRITRIGKEIYLRELRTPLKLLVALSSPRLVQRIDPRKEKATFEQALGEAIEKRLIEIEYLGFDDPSEVKFDKLQEYLAARDTPYDIVHIIGHGLLEAGEEGILALVEPSDGKQQDVRASSLANLFRSRGVMLVIMQSCQSGAVDSSALYFSGVAQQLVASGVPAVLAFQEATDQDVARHFIEKLYTRWLGDKCLFEDALTQARQSVNQEFSDRPGSWATPVLYICPGVQLLPSRAEPAEVVKERQVDAALPQQTRVGRETELIILIRTPTSPGLREMLGARLQDFDATPEDVRTSLAFDGVFPVDQRTGKVLSGTVEIVVETSDFDLPRSEDRVQIRPQGDSVLCVFPLTPKREGIAGLVVRVIDTSEEQVTLAQLLLKTQVQNGGGTFEAEYRVVDTYQVYGVAASLHIGDASFASGNLQQAARLYVQALTIAQETSDREGTVAAMQRLGNLYSLAGDLSRALELNAQALAMLQETYGDEHPQVATARSDLGRVLQAMGRLDEARAAFEQALAISEATLGPDHPDFATNVSNLGTVLWDLGDLTGARAAFERALTINEAVLGPDHPDVTADISNLGGVLWAMGDLVGAQAAFRRALAINETAFGPKHPRVATVHSNLGRVLWDLGDLVGAQAAFQRALSINESAHEPEQPAIARDLSNLGMVLRALGDLKEAQGALERAVAIDERVYGAVHPRVARDVNRLGIVLFDLEDLNGAREAFKRALLIDEAAFGPHHPIVGVHSNNLGMVLQALGDLEGAQTAFERALHLGEDRIAEHILDA